MNSGTFNIGSFSIENDLFILIFITLTIVLALLLMLWIWKLERRIKKLLGGKNNTNLESAITDNHQQIKELRNFQSETLNHLNNVEKRLKRSIQAIETVKFNPFKGTGAGGNQSFSSAFLDEKGDGLIVSGLYLRERFSVYAKPIKSYSGELEFSDEEKETISRARAKIQRS